MEEDKEIFVDDSHEHVKVQLFEVETEYAYSAPTGLFNLQLPHVEVKTSLYQTQSYFQYKRALAAEDNKENADLDIDTADQTQDPQEQAAEKEVQVEFSQIKDWEKSKKSGSMILKVALTNKSGKDDLKVWYKLSVGD